MGGIFLLVFVGLLVWFKVSGADSSGGGAKPVANVRCDQSEQSAVHFHAHLQLLYNATPVTVPASLGIKADCLYWLHTHNTDGVIHIEAPADQAKRGFTLGNFFDVWGQPLSATRLASLQVGSGQQEKLFVDGQAYTGDPRKIVLRSHVQVVIEIGPAFVEPPPAFSWPANLPS